MRANDRKTQNHNGKVVSYRVVAVVAGNSEAVTLSGLRADTQYQLVVTAVRAGKKFRSRPIVFRTLEPPRTSPQQDAAVTGGPLPPPPPSSQQPQPYIQHLHWSSHHVDSLDSGGALGWPRTSRPRVNSAIDVAGFLSQEFLRRHGSTSKLCRKVRSADNLPLASTNRQQDPRRNSKDESTEGDRESFLKPNQDDKSEDQDSRRQSSLESATKDNTETSLLDPSHQQPSSRWVQFKAPLYALIFRSRSSRTRGHDEVKMTL
ncbi:PREDICTED: uncharacterized protein LOC105557652 [Vollenhovia emeryi]|uniref:uncharacterized protein LOC105557652 n=1 Tax=Vollenhovia emeryi TaxID=411798 RepID=UPI0005F36E92|nr:PREDICTED: uncharacterized protein LOC105557652 [Vollenhovia emeryi]